MPEAERMVAIFCWRFGDPKSHRRICVRPDLEFPLRIEHSVAPASLPCSVHSVAAAMGLSSRLSRDGPLSRDLASRPSPLERIFDRKATVATFHAPGLVYLR